MAVEQIAQDVLLPALVAHVAGNAALQKGKSIRDIPHLVKRMPELATAYRTAPSLLLDPAQRESMIPGLLSAFLAVELTRDGWSARYGVETGLRLARNGREISAAAIVRQLAAGEMSEQEFFEAVEGGASVG